MLVVEKEPKLDREKSQYNLHTEELLAQSQLMNNLAIPNHAQLIVFWEIGANLMLVKSAVVVENEPGLVILLLPLNSEDKNAQLPKISKIATLNPAQSIVY